MVFLIDSMTEIPMARNVDSFVKYKKKCSGDLTIF